MRLDEFQIGAHFLLGGHRYRCTDKGTRVVVAICVDLPHEIVRLVQGVETRALTYDPSWFDGPPYPVPERVMDENDMIPCEPSAEPEKAFLDALEATASDPIDYP